MAALQGAIPFAQVADVAEGVGDDLDLDVAGRGEVALHIHGVVAERRLGLAAGRRHGLCQFFAIAGDLHAAPAAAGGGLDQDREADLLGRGQGFGLGLEGAF